MVRRGLAGSRNQASDLIAAGTVLVGGTVADRAARLVSPAEAVVLVGPPRRYVSRGGTKLAAALDGFAIDVTGHRVLDAGASTGGFTDCALQRGAAHVYSIDVGRNQLHEHLQRDARVTSREQTDIRTVTLDDLEGSGVDLVAADLSFISLRAVAPALVRLARPGADVVALVKPQFEAGRRLVGRGRGVIRDPEVWVATLIGAISALEAAGAAMMGAMVSPITGIEGNVEFLVHLEAGVGPSDQDLADRLAIETLVAEGARLSGLGS